MSGERYIKEFKIEVIGQVINRGYMINDCLSPAEFERRELEKLSDV